ncbi:MAG: GNAT family N-acetyltransferase, partial [Blastocatellia bacterium]
YITGASSRGLERCQVLERKVRAFLPLPSEHADFVKNLPSRLRQEIRRDRKVAKWRGAELKIVDRAEEFEQYFEMLIHLHQSRWTSRGKPGVFASERFTRFHRELGPILVDKGFLKLFVLLVDGGPVSAQQLFIEGETVSIYQSGFFVGESGIISPGTLLLDFAIEWAIGRGYSTWDFLKASEGSYKFRWNPSLSDIYDMRIAPSSSKEMIYVTTNRMIDGLRQIRRALR